MINLLEEINLKFQGKYNFLKLLNVVYEDDICIITFLYPYFINDFTEIEKESIEKFVKEFLLLNKNVKVKFKKSFLDEKLIINDILDFFKINKKGLYPYLSYDKIKISKNIQDVKINIYFNNDILGLIDEFAIRNDIKNFLERKYIANFYINIIGNNEVLPSEIKADDITPISNKVKRYNVILEKKLIGGDIIPKPEFIGNIKKAKTSVILAGFIDNIIKKTFLIKKGKNVGKEKSLYTFNLNDNSGKIECVHFCAKSNEKIFENLNNLDFLLCVGNIKLGLNGQLVYYINKISKANPILENEKQENICIHKQVVHPDLLPRNDQSNMFEVKQEYNDFIMKNNIVVFDIETTGLDFENDEITEIGAVKIEKGEITQRFSSFAKPKNPIPFEVQKLTNITNEMVENAPKIEDVIIDFFEWSRGCVISGYNVIGFDMKFIKKIANNLNLKFDNEVVDTMMLVRQSSLKVTNYKLGTVVKFFGLVLNDAHRAFNDAYATAKVLLELNKK